MKVEINIFHVIFFIVAYLLGSVPGGYIMARIKNVDIINQGSGNAGATNVLRTMGKKEAAITLIFDGAKGFLVIYAAQMLNFSPQLVLLSGILVIIGHNWPVFFGFKGGRGIATSLGILVGLSWQVILVVLVFGLLVIGISRYVSLGSITGAVILPFVMYFLGLHTVYIIFGIIMSVLGIVRHTPNIKRLLEGTENKIGKGR